MNWIRRRKAADNGAGASSKSPALKTGDMPEAKVVNENFERLMDDMNIPQDKRPAMLSKPLGEKWKLICLHDKAKKNQDKAGRIQESPQYFVHQLRDKPSLTALRTLGVLLKTKAVSWVKSFLDLGGLNVLFELLIANELKSNKSEEENQLQSECVYCLRALMNTEPGLKAFMESKDTMRNIALSLDSKNTRTRTQVLLLLAVVCNYSEEGFFLVLDAMNHYKLVKREKTRFQHLMDSLRNEVDVEHKIACMIFINALITSPNDSATRRMLKSEFVALGINDFIQEINRVEHLDETLSVQVTVFTEEMEDEDIDIHGFEDDPEDMLKRLEMTLKGSDAWDLFVSTFSALVTLSKATDAAETRSLWQKLLNFAGELQGGAEGGASSGGGSGEPSTKELQLQERVMTQNQMISDLQAQVHKLEEEVSDERNRVLADIERLAKGSDLKDNNNNNNNNNESGDSSEWRRKVSGLLEKIGKDHADLSQKQSDGAAVNTEEVNTLRSQVQELQNEIKNLKANPPAAAAAPAAAPAASGGEKSDDAASKPAATPPPPPPPPPGGAPAPPPPPPPPGGGPAPPPPPPPPGGGPPPPPPPPGGGPPPPPGGGPPPPPGAPPPPGGAPGGNRFGLPPLPAMKPKKRLKGYYWNKIPEMKVKDTIWMKNDIATGIEDIDLPTDDLENVFEAKSAAALGGDSGNSGPAKPEKVKIIDPKKAQNVGILVAGMRKSNKEIKQNLLAMDEDKVSVQNIKSLARIAPTSDELTSLKEFSGSPDDLDAPDRFLFDMIDIPSFEQRLDAWGFKRRFASTVEDNKPGISDILEATKELKESPKLKKLLTIVLAIGNYMNGGNRQRGNVYGVKLQSLMKMRDTKSTDNKTTLLRWMADYIEKKHPEVLEFEKEVSHVSAARRVAVPAIQQEINDLRKGIKMCKTQKEVAEKAAIPGDKFPEVMGKFITVAEREFESLEKQFNEMKDALEEIAKLFGEDPKTFSPEEFFGMMGDYFSAFHEALNLNQKARERAEKEKKKKAGGGGIMPKPKPKPQDGRGVLDGQLDSLVSGSGFKRRKPGPGAAGGAPSNVDMGELNAAFQLRKTGKKLA